MAQMQLMNIVNIGFEKRMPPYFIEVSANAMIDATQLFLQDSEVNSLRKELEDRMYKQRLII